ncbi:response regulator transcription factor [Calidifontibacillus oryziterrae]|uniref:response regulator transcription factor n=1 Tax=Calidifontibacillus oryziterrae TaxID=1191699 RepID=UPI0003160E79|nr:response regulator transcription factor [Calidifontibacillus oryziterrae]
MKISILIADDHTIVRTGIVRLLSCEKNVNIVGESKDGIETFEKTMQLLPDVVIMDLCMPGESGLVTLKRIKEHLPNVKVLILTMHDEPEMVLSALENGADGYILKSADNFDLIKAIEVVNSGEYYIFHKGNRQLSDFYKNYEQEVNSKQQPLSAREQEILGYIAKGYTNKELANMLFLSVKTLETYQARIKGKIGVKSRPELVKYALKKGLLNY